MKPETLHITKDKIIFFSFAIEADKSLTILFQNPGGVPIVSLIKKEDEEKDRRTENLVPYIGLLDPPCLQVGTCCIHD